jgi:hypothetical protein
MPFFAVFTAAISGGVAVISPQRFRKSEEICGRALASSLVLSRNISENSKVRSLRYNRSANSNWQR